LYGMRTIASYLGRELRDLGGARLSRAA
jgi:hypothetical protein